jgi:hypothetical protein
MDRAKSSNCPWRPAEKILAVATLRMQSQSVTNDLDTLATALYVTTTIC